MGVGSGRREIRGGGRARPAPWRESPPALHPAEAHAPLPDGEIVGACWRSAWCIPCASGRRVAPTGRSASSAACLEGSVASIYPPLSSVVEEYGATKTRAGARNDAARACDERAGASTQPPVPVGLFQVTNQARATCSLPGILRDARRAYQTDMRSARARSRASGDCIDLEDPRRMV